MGFSNWTIDDTKFGIPEDASPGHEETVHLSEGSSARLPWVFKAYRKVIKINNKMVIKKTVCARPKPPTTRPSLESCCVDKTEIEMAATDHGGNNSKCKMETVMKLL